MTQKARVVNFQSIGDVTLNLDGFVAITGPSNRGKSALIRALAATWFGQLGDTFVRRGQNKSNVVWLDGTHKIRWQKVVRRKVGEETYLEVDGIKNTKLGREHGLLTKPLGFVEIETTTSRMRPQVAMQHDPIFLLTESETAAAELFKMLGRVDVVTQAQQLARSDVVRDTRLQGVREGDLKTAETEADGMDYVPMIRAELDAVSKEVASLIRTAEEKTELRIKAEILKGIEKVDLPEPPKVDITPGKADVLIPKIRRLRELKSRELPITPVISSEMVIGMKDRAVGMIKVYNMVSNGLLMATTLKEAAERELEAIEAELIKAKGETEVCPICERPFQDDLVQFTG